MLSVKNIIIFCWFKSNSKITPKYQIEDGGITYHIPFTLGLKLAGNNHQKLF